LYGEEATQKAQREGEEAAAAWEQEKKDIAAGIIVVPIKPVRKKKVNATKSATGKNPPKKRQSKTASTGKKTGKVSGNIGISQNLLLNSQVISL